MISMPVIHCLPDEATLSCAPGTRILHALQEEGLPIAHACGGGARCSTCRVHILAGLDACEPRNDAEQRIAQMLRFPDDIRLACQTEVRGPVVLRRLVLDEQDLMLTSRIHGVRDDGQVGRELFVAVLFADIRDFTPLAEGLPAYDIVHLLNRYFASAGRVVATHRGRIVNYMGDGFLALFDAAGGDSPQAPLHATLAALALRDAARDVSHYVAEVYGRSFAVGMGVHAGMAVVGDVGALGERRETAIGDTVNLASRIEAATKEAETDLLVSDQVRAHVEHLDVVELAGDAGRAGPRPAGIRFGRRFELPMKGKTGIFTVHEVLGLAEP
jgi:adenylate cyclase